MHATSAAIREKEVHVARERELTLIRPQLWPRLTDEQHKVAQDQAAMDSIDSTRRWLLIQSVIHGIETRPEDVEMFQELSAVRVQVLWLGSEIHNGLDGCGWVALDCFRFEDVAARGGRLDLLIRLHGLKYFDAAKRCTGDDSGWWCYDYVDNDGFWHFVAHGVSIQLAQWLASLPGCWDLPQAACLCAQAAHAGSLELLAWGLASSLSWSPLLLMSRRQ